MGHEKDEGLIAVSRKLLGIIYAIVRDDSEYSANFESMKRQVIKRPHKVLFHRRGDHRFLPLRRIATSYFRIHNSRQHPKLN